MNGRATSRCASTWAPLLLKEEAEEAEEEEEAAAAVEEEDVEEEKEGQTLPWAEQQLPYCLPSCWFSAALAPIHHVLLHCGLFT